MALSKADLIASLQNEVRILLHLTTKIDKSMLEYRPTPKQRSTIELLRYLSIMGPGLVPAIKTGTFDGAAWGTATAAAAAKDFDAIVADLAKQSDFYASAVGEMPEASFAEPLEMFGRTNTRGYHLVNLVVSGHAAYRTQLFCYLKACGKDDLNTSNLWGGVDAPMS
ncbi:MAG: hypothetical protein ABI811_05000 [Acidobacteriota bacterium]